MYSSTDPLFAAVAARFPRAGDSYAEHVREAMTTRRVRRSWRRERAPRATVAKPVAIAACPESSHCLVWLS